MLAETEQHSPVASMRGRERASSSSIPKALVEVPADETAAARGGDDEERESSTSATSAFASVVEVLKKSLVVAEISQDCLQVSWPEKQSKYKSKSVCFGTMLSYFGTARQKVAIKFFEYGELNDDECRRFVREAQILTRMFNPNVVKLIGMTFYEHRVALVLERVPMNLYKMIKKRKQQITGCFVYRLASGLINGLGALHSAKLIHRDLNPENLLVDPEIPEGVKICDFRISRLDKAGVTYSLGTLPYQAPECLLADEPVSPALAHDIYAYGVVLHECLMNERLAADWGLQRFFKLYESGNGHLPLELSMLPCHVSNDPRVPELLQLCNRCMSLDPGQRPTCDEIRRLLNELKDRTVKHQGDAVKQFSAEDRIWEDTAGKEPEDWAALESIVQESEPCHPELDRLEANADAQAQQFHDGLRAIIMAHGGIYHPSRKSEGRDEKKAEEARLGDDESATGEFPTLNSLLRFLRLFVATVPVIRIKDCLSTPDPYTGARGLLCSILCSGTLAELRLTVSPLLAKVPR